MHVLMAGLQGVYLCSSVFLALGGDRGGVGRYVTQGMNFFCMGEVLGRDWDGELEI
jgi:hypothetical protein